MGILNSLGISNGLTDFLAAHRGALMDFGAGLASGPTLSQGIALGTQGLQKGAQADDAYATAQKAEQQRQDQINATVKYLQSNPAFADLVPIAQAGDGATALTEAFKRSTPGYGEQTVAPGYTVLGADNQPVYTAPIKPPNSTGNAPSGFRFTADGQSLEPIPGGPADPKSAQSLSPEALDLISSQYLAGDKSAITGYARNANMRAQIANAVAEKANAMGMDGKGLAAEISAYGGNVAAQRAAGTRAAQVGMASSEANQMADIALEASAKVPRSSFVPWNAAVNAVRTNTSSPEMAAFVTATTSLVNAYARAVSPLGAPTDAMRQHAEQMLNTAQSPEAYAAVIAQMKNEMKAALDAPAEISSNLKSSITGAPASTAPAAGQNTTSTGVNWSFAP
jgi:hypothetical protein